MTVLSGNIEKMKTENLSQVQYTLNLREGEIIANSLLGKKISLKYLGKIRCIECGKSTKKSFGQGYCFPCFRSLARCDMCIVRPETCHFHEGTCREPDWGEKHCMIPHVVYLANSSGLKVGITREHQKTTRWMDQGAIQAIPIARVNSRLESGQAESELKKHVDDKTNWRKMLKGEVTSINMQEKREIFLKYWPKQVTGEFLTEDPVFNFEYPVNEFPEKIKSHNWDKEPLLEGTLMGIKAQYFILDTAVINIRKYIGYEINLSFD